MENRSLMMLRVFINRFNPAAGDALLKFLPQEEMKAVLSQNIRSKELTPLLEQPKLFLKSLHYTWIQPVLNKFPEKLRPLLVSALQPEQIVGLQENQQPLSLSPPVKNFLVNLMYEAIKTEDHIPLEYLPITDLTPLSTYSKAELVTVADFLGLHDLASEIRHIVNKDHLKNIYGCLSQKEYSYLSICLHQTEKIITPKIGIDPTVKDDPQLRKLIHKRGLLRLGKALCGQHPDFVWHLAHILDAGRGKIILSAYHPEGEPEVTSILKTQVMNIMNFIKNG